MPMMRKIKANPPPEKRIGEDSPKRVMFWE
jgi:hypothetical protein